VSNVVAQLQARPPGVWTLGSNLDAAELCSCLHAAGWQCHIVDGSAVTGKASFLDACASTLAFPDWFGGTWDAFVDCLTDLSWLPPSRRVLALDAIGAFVAAGTPSWTTAVSCLRQATQWWSPTRTPLQVLVRSDGVEPPGLPALEG
jgi:barstar (barnase inhibitor)